MSSRHASRAAASAAGTVAKDGARPPSPDADDTEAPDPSPGRDQRIRELAYSLYVERGGSEGHALDDWLLAESKLALLESNGGTPVPAKGS